MSCPVFVHIENERLLFFLNKKCAIWKIANFLLIFALLLFLKERKKDCSFCCSFENSDKKSDCSFALFVAFLFKRATKRAIAHLLFFKERLNELF